MKKSASVRKILQALYYIQSKAPSENQSRFNRVYLLKLIFASDRYHLRHFGSCATNDEYYAMKLGPVASKTSDILKGNSFCINSAEQCYLAAVHELSENDVLIDPQDEDELSDSFKEAMNFALAEFGTYSWGQMSDITHFYPEWKKHENNLSQTNRRILMDKKDFFDDPENENCLADFGKKADPFKDDREFLELLKGDFDADTVSA